MADLRFVHEELAAFDKRPHRAETLYDLAKFYRERGQNHASLLFSERGLALPYPEGDSLFIEDHVYRYGFREEYAICGFYDEARRARAAEICDGLSLDRSVPQQVRDTARANLYYYTRPISELLPSWRERKCDFVPPDDYRPMNISVTRLGSRLVIAARTVNYWIDERFYVTLDGGPIHSRTFLGVVDPLTMADHIRCEITLPEDWPSRKYDGVQGFEDMRLFGYEGDLWGISTVREQSADTFAEQWIAKVSGAGVMSDCHPIIPYDIPRLHEKNWMPITDGDECRGFLYLCDPTRVIDGHGQTRVLHHEPAIAADHFRGGSQLIRFDDGWLAVVHSTVWIGGWPKYRHRFIWFDAFFHIRATSQQFMWPSEATPELLRGYQYVMGLCWHPDGQHLVMSFQKDERESWMGLVLADDVRAVLRTSAALTPSHRAMVDRWKEFIGGTWAGTQTNMALQSKREIAIASAALEARGLPHHHDGVKDWDTAIGIYHCMATTKYEEPVLDAGGDRFSIFLPALVKLGYKDLANYNLDNKTLMGPRDGINWITGDITRTIFPDGQFAFVACISVIEHGVDVPRFLAEMARILRPGGHLFVSFDYWETPIDCGSRMAFGAPVKIFDQQDVRLMMLRADEVGLEMVGPGSAFDCSERPINWVGMDFTFANALFRRR